MNYERWMWVFGIAVTWLMKLFFEVLTFLFRIDNYFYIYLISVESVIIFEFIPRRMYVWAEW